MGTQWKGEQKGKRQEQERGERGGQPGTKQDENNREIQERKKGRREMMEKREGVRRQDRMKEQFTRVEEGWSEMEKKKENRKK